MHIIFKELQWSNVFSFGANNTFDFSSNKLTQFVGKNGHGKTSVSLVLEEALFNKNSKGISRSGVLNRYTKDRFYTIRCVFEKNSDEYVVETRRTASSQTVKLLKNGEDISSHTPTGTYKQLESILGMDHKTFSQIVNQRNASNLKFLTATDSERKNFFIELLSLSTYSNGLDYFKQKAKDAELKSTALSATIDSLEKQLIRLRKSIVPWQDLVPVPEPVNYSSEIAMLKAKIADIAEWNKKILQNKKFAEMLRGIKLGDPVEQPKIKPSSISTEIALEEQTAKEVSSFVTKMNSLGTKCATCLSPIDAVKVRQVLEPKEQQLKDARARITELKTQLNDLQASWVQYQKYVADKRDYEEYHSLYDPSLPTQVESVQELQAKLENLTSLVSKNAEEIKRAEDHNNKANINNAKLATIEGQIGEIEAELPEHQNKLSEVRQALARYQILVKVFSNNGLVAYKIECLVQDLEKLTNEYLSDLSDGRFQICFELSSNDKLNVVVNDNGTAVEIGALSNGEAARVNTAALLGIRKLMQILSSNRVNLLFLDETIDSLDDEGKEKLVEVLLKENHLNTIVVSHGFQHPLIERVKIIKTNKISRMEHG